MNEFTYTRGDFETAAPYEFVESIADPFKKQLAVNKLASYASALGVKDFRRSLLAYRETHRTAK